MMGGLTIINHNGQKTIDSREVAEMVGKDHKNLLRDIRGYVEVLLSSDLSSVDFFIESTYADSTGRSLPYYESNRKGSGLLPEHPTEKKG